MLGIQVETQQHLCRLEDSTFTMFNSRLVFALSTLLLLRIRLRSNWIGVKKGRKALLIPPALSSLWLIREYEEWRDSFPSQKVRTLQPKGGPGKERDEFSLPISHREEKAIDRCRRRDSEEGIKEGGSVSSFPSSSSSSFSPPWLLFIVIYPWERRVPSERKETETVIMFSRRGPAPLERRKISSSTSLILPPSSYSSNLERTTSNPAWSVPTLL